MDIIGIIPARFDSTRFPGKPLADIAGKSMIRRVYEQVKKVNSLNSVVVATDDERIAAHVLDFEGEVIMTAPTHMSGTDRCAEALQYFPGAKIVINIQGDEPFINPLQIEKLIECFESEETEIATLIKKIDTDNELFDPNTPKVVIDKNFKALYFSRSPIPYQRSSPTEKWLINDQFYYKHIGIYGFRADTLNEITKLPTSSLERTESLEQLRWLENGYTIKTAETSLTSIGIDHPDDIQRALKEWKNLL